MTSIMAYISGPPPSTIDALQVAPGVSAIRTIQALLKHRPDTLVEPSVHSIVVAVLNDIGSVAGDLVKLEGHWFHRGNYAAENASQLYDFLCQLQAANNLKRLLAI